MAGMTDEPAPRTGGLADLWAGLGSLVARTLRWWAVPGWRAHVTHALGVFVVGVVGAAIGAALAPSTTATIGPIQAEVSVVPSLSPGVHLLLPPAGEVDFATHVAPFAVQARISEVDLEGARALIASPANLRALQATAPEDLRSATLLAAASTAACSFTGALVLSVLVYRRRWIRTAHVASAVALVLVAVGGGGAWSFDPDKLAQPRFTGLLGQAPYISGRASSLVQRLESYRSGLADIVSGVTTLYAAGDRLPVLPAADDVVPVLHVSDIHLNPLAFDLIERLVTQFRVEVVVDTGDITTWGTEVESSTLSRIKDVGVPYVFVRGNHDSKLTQQAVAQNPNAVVLDGDVREVKGIVFAGIGDPRFTADPDAPIADAATPPASIAPPATALTSPAPGAASPSRGASPSVAPSGSPTGSAATGTPAPSASASGPSPQGTALASPRNEGLDSPDPEVRAGARLLGLIQSWNARNPTRPVAVAAVHEPYAVPPLLGSVPLVLAGHMHTRSVRLDPSGTRVMIQGSTGGAGISSSSLRQITDGDPVPLDATLLYVARRGERAGQVVAYDEITVGGFGLASVTIDRVVVRPGAEAVLAPGQQGPPTPGPTPSPSTSPTPAPAVGGSPSAGSRRGLGSTGHTRRTPSG
jgi:predicted MPP superfamily phosphohydrolase